MPKTATKRNATSASSTNANKKQKTPSPYDQYFDAQKEFLNQHKDILGMTVVKGLPQKADKSKYTQAQLNSFRCIMITKNRSDQLEKMTELILQDQAHEDFQSFTTSFSYDVLDSWPILQKRMASQKTPAQKLDMLMAYTFILNEYDVWMSDNEGNMGGFVKNLAAAWKQLLSLEDAALGWDLEYTKPGIQSLLVQFKKAIQVMSKDYQLGKFQYQ